jgi:hypothetical protein
MTNVLRFLTAAAALIGAAPAIGQTLLLDVTQTLPLAGALDNPCTVTPEAIAFTGSTNLTQRVWLLPNGNFRLQFYESTSLQGQEAAAVGSLLGPLKYVVSGESNQDLEVEPFGFEVLQYKKVQRDGGADNFHSVLVLAFDPQNLQLQAKLEGACDNGMP